MQGKARSGGAFTEEMSLISCFNNQRLQRTLPDRIALRTLQVLRGRVPVLRPWLGKETHPQRGCVDQSHAPRLNIPPKLYQPVVAR
jgi:hypothetical protein